MYVIRMVDVEPAMYIAEWDGDPGRTFVLETARRFRTRRGARIVAGRLARLWPRRGRFEVEEIEA